MENKNTLTPEEEAKLKEFIELTEARAKAVNGLRRLEARNRREMRKACMEAAKRQRSWEKWRDSNES